MNLKRVVSENVPKSGIYMNLKKNDREMNELNFVFNFLVMNQHIFQP